MSAHPAAETTEAHGCEIVLRRVAGPEATELFLHGRPARLAGDADHQAEAVYRAIGGVLDAEGGAFESVVSETLFLRSVHADLGAVRAARGRALGMPGGPTHRPATTEIEQPPLDAQAHVEVSLQAILPHRAPLEVETLQATTACDRDESAVCHGLRIRLGEETRLHASGLHGRGVDAYAQAVSMFEVAEGLLQRAGMEFRDVVRTWIHLRDIDRDYDALNRARREFFEARGIDPAPASTGIGGGPPVRSRTSASASTPFGPPDPPSGR